MRRGHPFMVPAALAETCILSLARPALFVVTSKRDDHGRGMPAVTERTELSKDLVRILPRLRRFALTLARNPDDADDLVQAACERAIARASQWQPGSRLDSWLFTMMRHIWVSEMRSRRVRLGQGHIDAAETDELATFVGPADHIYGNQLVAMMMSMPEGLSAILLLVSVEGHSYNEAADILDIPVGTVMSRMSRARNAMKDLLAKADGVTV